jgi:hypothetical protein
MPSRLDERAAGRNLGVVCGLVVCAAAIYSLSIHPGNQGRGQISETNAWLTHDYRLRMLPTIIGVWLAIVGSLRGRPLFLVLAFFIGFFSFFVGLYTLLVPLGFLSLIGYGELGYLLAAGLLWRARSGATGT